MLPAGMAPVSAAVDRLPGGVVAAAPGVVTGLAVAGVARADAVKATTCSADAASRRPSPALGVGKWLAGTPTGARRPTRPVAGASQYRGPFWPMVQTRPAATMGGPPLVTEVQSRRSLAGDRAAR